MEYRHERNHTNAWRNLSILINVVARAQARLKGAGWCNTPGNLRDNSLCAGTVCLDEQAREKLRRDYFLIIGDGSSSPRRDFNIADRKRVPFILSHGGAYHHVSGTRCEGKQAEGENSVFSIHVN